MFYHLLSASLTLGAACHTPAESLPVKRPAFATYAQFNDSLVAQFNRGAFATMDGYGSATLNKVQPAGSLGKYLEDLQKKTGRIKATRQLQARGTRHEFLWQGETQSLRFALVAATPGVVDDYIFTDLVPQGTAPGRTPTRTDNPRKTALDAAVHQAASLYMQHPEAAGLSIGVYQQGKQYFYNYGEVEKGTGKLPTSTTYYDLGSVAKTFVGTLLAQAVLDKKVKLTDDVRRYLPGEFPNLEVEGQPIRLVDLANHTSGIHGPSRGYNAATKQKLGSLNFADKIAYYNKYTADSLLLDLHSCKLATKPGTAYRYSGVGMLVLQYALERAYQQPYEQLVTKYVQTHFGMFDAKRVLSAAELKRFAMGYENQQPQAHPNYTGYWGGPTLCSTAADLVKYAKANLAELDPAVRLAHQPTSSAAPSYALGLTWRLDTDTDGLRRIHHSGHSPGFNTWFVLYPELNLGLVVLANETTSQERLAELGELIKQGLPVAQAPAISKPAPSARAAAQPGAGN